MFDPVLAGYRRLLSEAGMARVTHRAALMRVPDEGACEVGAGQCESGTVCVNPPVLMLLKGYVPIRLDCSGGELQMRVFEYELEGGLSRRSGEGAGLGSVPVGEAGKVLAGAREEFCRLRRELLSRTAAGIGIAGSSFAAAHMAGGAPWMQTPNVIEGESAANGNAGAGGGTRADEMWLSRQLFESTGGLAAVPVRLAGDAGAKRASEVEIRGIRVRVGTWVYVRLETRAGLVMTEPAMLMGAETLGGAVRLVLRGSDGVITTCWTRGPGWQRRVVPVGEGEAWKAVEAAGLNATAELGLRRDSA
jgi:hypothetical protein